MFILLLLLVIANCWAQPSSSITVYVNDSSPLASNSTSCGPVTEPCQTLDLGLDVIQYSLKGHNVSDASVELIIADGEYDHTNTSNGVFEHIDGIMISGSAATTVNCANDSGFSFIYSSHIVISGIEFIGCGQLQNSTSYTSDTSFSLFYVGLYFLYCRDVNLTEVSVSHSQATGIVLYNIIGTNILDTLTVSNNIFTTDREMEGSGGGVYIEYSYCVPSGHESGIIDCLSQGISNVDIDYTNNSSFLITNSSFTNNQANISDTITSTFILPSKQNHAPFGRGGGFSVFFKGNASNNSITVTDCTFNSNRALWGGGLFVEFQDSAFKNNFTITSSHLLNNSLYFNDSLNEGTGGGGARVGYIFFDKAISYSNEIVFNDCVFDNNSAYYGGGLSFYSARQSLVDDDHLLNTLKLVNCNFTGNIGRLGAGLDLSLWHPSFTGKHPYCLIEDTVFINNYPVHPSNGGLVGIGAVYIDSLPTILRGQVSFEGNNGTAFVATGTHVNISNGTNVTFTGNSGRNGGAIALLDGTFIVTSEGSSLYFINNWALYKGGAIYSFRSGERDLLSSRNCFLRYENISIDPKEWNVDFFFQNNTIKLQHDETAKYNAIYATSLLPCIWGGPHGNSTYKNFNESKVFCWNECKWTYKDEKGHSTSCNSQILSSPMTYSNTKSSYSKKPGQPIQLGFTVRDELSNNVTNTSIFIARVINGNGKFRNNSLFTYISHGHLEVYGMPYSNIRVQLETLDPVVTRNTMSVTIEPCAPGFTFDNSSMGCYCYKTSAFNGYIQCNQKSFHSTILRTAWVGKRPGGQFLVAGETQYSDRNTINRNTTLYNDSEEYLNKIFCGYSYRNGTLCGSCQDGYGVEVTSYQYDCINCTGSQGINWVYYVLSTYLPITVFFIIVFLFSVTVTSGPLNAFVFFAQVVATTISVDADGMIPLQNAASTKLYPVLTDFYVSLYSIWNMKFYTGFIKKFCLSPSFNTMDVFLLRYGEALYPLVLLFIIVSAINLYNKGFCCVVLFLRPFHYCLARFRQWSNLRQSVTGGIAVFIVISYTKFTLISLRLLTPTDLYDSTGHKVASVHYYDGDIDFPQNKYIIPAIIVLVTFGLFPPLLLIYPSVLRLIERLSCWRLKMTKLYPFPKLAMFMNEFYGCYKDGQDTTLDCRWFAGFYFILRIILFTVYSFTEEWHTQYLVQILLFLLVAFLFAFIRPYRDDWVNNIDCGFFLLLSAISVISLFNLMKTRIGESLGHWAFAIQYILILIPLLYCIGYYLVFVCKRSKDAFKKYTAAKLRQAQEAKDQQNDEDSRGYRNALVDSNHVPSMMEYIGPQSRMRLSNSASWRARSGETAPLLPERNREAIIESTINE